MDISTLQHIWYLLMGVLFAVYAVLDGFDLGIGILLPFLSRDEKDSRILFKTIGPLWDGNEVWLLTAAGSLFAAFSIVYATVFSGFYLAMMFIIFALIFRAVSLEFWSLDEKRRHLWELTFTLGSLVPALLFGIALGNVIVGIPMDHEWNYTGSFATLFRPFPLAIGLLGLSSIVLQGATFTIYKTQGFIQQKAKNILGIVWYVHVGLIVIALILSFMYVPDSMSRLIPWLGTVILIGSIIMLKIYTSKQKEIQAFFMSSLAFIALWGIAGGVHYPLLVKATPESGFDLTLSNASSSALTLQTMLIIALIGLPLVIGYTVYVYKLFKGKIQE